MVSYVPHLEMTRSYIKFDSEFLGVYSANANSPMLIYIQPGEHRKHDATVKRQEDQKKLRSYNVLLSKNHQVRCSNKSLNRQSRLIRH